MSLDVTVVLPLKLAQCESLMTMSSSEDSFRKEWVGLALLDIGFLSGILIIACRHLCQCHYEEAYYTRLAAQYRTTCVQSLRASIASNSPVSGDLAVSMALALAFDAVRRNTRPTSDRCLN